MMASCESQPISFPVPEYQTPRAAAESAGPPAGFPNIVDSSLAWAGSEFATEFDYVLELTEEHLAEAEVALESFKAGQECSR